MIRIRYYSNIGIIQVISRDNETQLDRSVNTCEHINIYTADSFPLRNQKCDQDFSPVRQSI